MAKAKVARNKELLKLIENSNLTFSDIGALMGISPERVRQINAEHNFVTGRERRIAFKFGKRVGSL